MSLLQRVLNARPDWELNRANWPNTDHSRFINAGELRWHVQIAGQGESLLLLHGTAASTHSFADLLPLLAQRYTVIAPDLPGHGFTSAPPAAQLSLTGMAAAIGELLTVLQLPAPRLVVGHSAGAAILAQCCFNGAIAPDVLISLSGALLPLRGMPGKFFSPLARFMARNAFIPHIVSYDARRRGAIERLIDSTGSQLTADGIARYRLLVQTPGHVAAALNMMANWDLHGLQAQLPHLPCRLLLVAATNDKTIPPSEAERVQRLLPQAELITLNGLGHLAHEEDAERVAAVINHAAQR